MKARRFADIPCMKSKVDPRLLIVLGIALVVLVGFGAVQVLGGDDEAAPTAAGSSTDADADADAEGPIDGQPIVATDGQSDWAAQATVICSEGVDNVTLDADATSPEAVADAIAQVRGVIDELGALDPPPGAEAEAAEFVSLLESSLDAASALFPDGGEVDLEALGGFLEEQAATGARLIELGGQLGVDACVSGPAGSGEQTVPVGTLESEPGAQGLLDLQGALQGSESVVVVVYTPNSELDTRVVREARAGASGSGAGFLAVNGTRQGQIKLLAEAFELRETPTTLVVNRGLVVASRFSGFTDRETVAQAVKDSLASS